MGKFLVFFSYHQLLNENEEKKREDEENDGVC